MTDSIAAPLDAEVSALFALHAQTQNLLRVCAALAHAEAECAVIPNSAAEAIASACQSLKPDLAAYTAAQAREGDGVGELLRQLRAAVGGTAAGFVAYGASPQDLSDTALVLHISAALANIERALARLITQLAGLAREHRDTLIAAGTSTPVTLGFLLAGWLAPLLRHRERLAALKPRVLLVQLGGAAGTLAALRDRGSQTRVALAVELGLGVPAIAWRDQRDGLAELASWLSALQAQLTVQRHAAIAIAQRNAGVVFNEIDAYTAPVLPTVDVFTLDWRQCWSHIGEMHAVAAGLLGVACETLDGMSTDPARLAAGIAEACGVSLAERYRLALTPKLGHVQATRVVAEACEAALRERRDLADILRAKFGTALDWDALRDPRDYLGDSGTDVDRVLAFV